MIKIILYFIGFILINCQSKPISSSKLTIIDNKAMQENNNLEKATFAGGCFWCTEAVFSSLKGVKKVTSGYIGGNLKNPTYEDICTGLTQHAEAVEIIFNADEILYEDLLEIFFATHNPTTLNQQGADIGTQYRSEIFYHNLNQKEKAEQYIKWLASEKVFSDKIVTKVSNATTFYKAEDYHQDYYVNNQNKPYCLMVIAPKLEKLRKYYASKLN